MQAVKIYAIQNLSGRYVADYGSTPTKGSIRWTNDLCNYRTFYRPCDAKNYAQKVSDRIGKGVQVVCLETNETIAVNPA